VQRMRDALAMLDFDTAWAHSTSSAACASRPEARLHMYLGHWVEFRGFHH
jgi:hypothetical protein